MQSQPKDAHNQDYDHAVFVAGGWLSPQCIVIECDRFKAWLYLGMRRKERIKAGMPTSGFRRKEG